MDKSKQLVLAILSGFDASHDLVKEAVADQQIAVQLLRREVKIEKADLFAKLSTGKSILEYEDAWKNIAKLAGAVRIGGDTLAYEDFRKQLVLNETASDIAFKFKQGDKLFLPEFWKNRSERDMVAAWHEAARHDADKYDFLAIKRALAAVQGRELREDKLVRMNIRPEDIRDAIKKGEFADLSKKFARHGDHLRVQDLFILDFHGDHMLDSRSAWQKFDILAKELQTHGERLNISDFLFHIRDRKSMLEYANGEDELGKIFNPALWRGRSQEMVELFSHVPSGAKRDKVKIEGLLNQIAELDYGGRVAFDSSLSRARLVLPLNEEERAKPDFQPVIALGLDATWKRMDEVRQLLREKGEEITLADLQRPSGYGGESCLRLAARNGHFAQVMDILAESGERLGAAALKAEGKDGQSLLAILADNGDSKHLLKPELWAGRGNEFLEVWDAMPSRGRNNVDFAALQSRITLLSLRQRFGDGPRPPAP